MRLLAVLAATLLSACASGPQTVHIGSDTCAHCSMVISDDRFAAQLQTSRGRTYTFDSIECLASFARANPAVMNSARGAWVSLLDAPGSWIAVEDAAFLRSEELRTPMGGGLAAFVSEDAARVLSGVVVSWTDLLEMADEHDAAHAGH